MELDEIERYLLHYTNQGPFRGAAVLEKLLGHGLMHDAVLFSSLSPQATDLLSSDTANTRCMAWQQR